MDTLKWIRITTNVFNDRNILMIEDLPDADKLIVIWFKLLCLAGAGDNGGMLLFREHMPYTEEMLAAIFRRPLNTVRLALRTFEEYGMIEIVDNTYYIPKFDEYNVDAEVSLRKEKDRLRQQKHREKQRLAIEAAMNGKNLRNAEDSEDCHVTCHVTDNVTSVTGNVTNNVTDNVTCHVTSNVTPIYIDKDTNIGKANKDTYIDNIYIDNDKSIYKDTPIDKTYLDNTDSLVGRSHPDSADSDESTPSKTKNRAKRKVESEEPEEPAIVSIELNDGSLYGVTQKEIDYYAKLYPAVDIVQEMRKIAGWNHSNTGRRKTRSGIKKHINTWLSKAQDRGGSKGSAKVQSAYTYDYNSYDDSCPY